MIIIYVNEIIEPLPSSKSSPGAVKVILTPEEGCMLSTALAVKSTILPGGILVFPLSFITYENIFDFMFKEFHEVEILTTNFNCCNVR